MPDVDGLNAGYATTILEQYLENPESVPSEWRALFESGESELVRELPGLARLLETMERNGGNGGAAAAAPPAPAAAPAVPQPGAVPDELLLGGVAAAMALVKAHRMHGHLAARLDPLGSEPVGDPALEPERLIPKLTPELQARIPASLLRLYVPAQTLADALPRLRETYCGTLSYEIEHLSDHELRVWLRKAIESGRYRRPLSAEEQKRLLERLTEVEGMERYLRRAFLGQKPFSIEGLDVMVPMLDEAIELSAEAGAHEVVIGMAHRGRLTVLAHTLGQPYEAILREFEGERSIEAVVSTTEGGSGDVKYHLGAEGVRKAEAGEITVALCANPSHLEAVNPVVEGRARAEQTDRSTRAGVHDPGVALPILIHGDASFAGQGIVAETLNLEGLAGYTTGGTLHLIANNQVGFTTDPAEGRSTRYSSDLAKGFDVPIIHVNADDPEAAISAIRLALAFRQRFGHDVVVDLVGYRRFGHNEQDEPAYTQPLMAQIIASHPTVREQYATRLAEEGVVPAEEAEHLDKSVETELKAAHERLKEAIADDDPPETPLRPVGRDQRPADRPSPPNACASSTRSSSASPTTSPSTRSCSSSSSAARRRSTRAESTGARPRRSRSSSLLVEGIPIRLTGQDTERGTFSHRHLVLHDADTGERYAPIQHLERRDRLVRGAQLAALRVRLRRLRVRLLGRRAGGARPLGGAVRRLRQRRADHPRPVHRRRPVEVGRDLAADPAAAARLRGQRARALERAARALPPVDRPGEHPRRQPVHRRAVLPPAPATGARAGRAAARRDDAEGAAPPAGGGIDASPTSPRAPSSRCSTTRRQYKERTQRLVLCSGKVYYDIAGHELRADADHVAVARIEQLYPFPSEQVEGPRRLLPEPRGGRLGAGGAAEHGRVALDPAPPRGGAADGVPLRYVGRPWRASPSEGYPTAHLREQDRIVREALGA